MMNKKIILLFIVIIFIIGGIYYLEKTKIKTLQEDKDYIQNISEELKNGYKKAPELTGISGYLNTEKITIRNITKQGKVVLVDFWTYTCINCIRTFPYLTSWDEKYRNMGLVIIGVHTPEFTFEKNYENVKQAIEKYNIKYPVVQDNDYLTWQAFNNHYWPRKYLIDKEGYIRYDHIGEGGYEETEEKIKELLSEIGSDTKHIEITKEEIKRNKFFITNELYAGHAFALSRDQNIGNKEGLQPGETIDYLPDRIDANKIYLKGNWKSNPDDLQLIGEEGSVILSFFANSANIVAEALSEPVEAEVFIDGNYITQEQAGKDVQFNGSKAFIKVTKPQLYNVVDGDYGNYELTIKINQKNFTLNSFTFG